MFSKPLILSALYGLVCAKTKMIELDVRREQKFSKTENLFQERENEAMYAEYSDSQADQLIQSLGEIEDDVIVKDLKDASDVQIFATVYVGSDHQPFDLLFDTGSNWLWVFSEDCMNCPFVNRFDDESSDSFKLVQSHQTSLYYGSGSVTGYEIDETVCLSKKFCSKEFRMMNIMSQKDLGGLRSSGIVGLSPNHYENRADLFIEKMKKTGAIDEAVFSMSIGMGNIQSKITFGGFDLKRFAEGPIQWHNIVKGSRYWEVGLSTIHFQNEIEEWVYGPRRAIVDSGTSYTLIPKVDYDRLLNHLKKTYEFKFISAPNGLSICGCTEWSYNHFPNLRFQIDDKVYTLPRQSYVQFIKSEGACKVNIMTHPSLPIWILGLNFFENYYTVFDQENHRVGFAPSIHQQDEMQQLVEDIKPNTDLTFASLIGLAVAAFISCALWKAKKQSEKQEGLRYNPNIVSNSHFTRA